jgi:DNA mismatch repair protein MutS
MDEVGRGTSTFDGLSLAWACAAYLATEVKALTLFATHYFELTHLPEFAKNAANVHLGAVEHEDTIVFLHTVNAGPANKSYGLQVAQLAGIPRSVIFAAKQKLAQLENVDSQVKNTVITDDIDDFGTQLTFADEPQFASHPVITKLQNIDPNNLSPKDALAILFQLKEITELSM